MNVTGRAFHDGGDGALAEPGAVALVVPEGLRPQQMEAQKGRQQQHEHGRRQKSPVSLHLAFGGTRARKRLKNRTAAANRNNPGRARIQVYFQAGMGDKSGVAVA